MLINITIENFRSFNEEQTLSLIASSDDGISSFEVDGLSVRKSAVIYGANANGKSNFILALMTFQTILSEKSSSLTKENYMEFYKPFWNNDNPSKISLDFACEDKIYTYTVSYNALGICGEELLDKNDNIIFKRYIDEHNTNDQLIKYKYIISENKELLLTSEQLSIKDAGGKYLTLELWKNSTNQFQLFLRKIVVEHSCEKLSKIYKFLAKDILIRDNPYYQAEGNLAKLDWGNANNFYLNQGGYDEIVSVLNKLGVNLKRIEVEKTPMGSLIANSVYEIDGKEFKSNFVETESDGTVKMFNYFSILPRIMKQGGVLIVDELETHFHPLLLERIIERINFVESKAQLIFTTHNSTLISATLFKPDQIYFLEKNKKFASEFYSLDDFDENANVEKMYLAGRFGATPNTKGLL